jgi:hypothetical protein
MSDFNRINISICPTSLEFGNGDTYDKDELLDSLLKFCKKQYPVSNVSLQIGHRQGDEWAVVDGDGELGLELVQEFFAKHGTDEGLFKERKSNG